MPTPTRNFKHIGFGSNILSNIVNNINNSSEGNIAIGMDSLNSTTTGSYNITLGQQTLYLTDVGSSNVAVGYNSGYKCKTGTNNTFLGSNTQFDNVSNTYSNSTAIGYNCVINDSNKIVLGTAYENVCVPGNMMINKTSTTYDFDVNGTTHCSDDMYLYGKTININKSGAITTVKGNVYVNGQLDMDNANLIGSGDISGSLTVPLGKLVNYPGGWTNTNTYFYMRDRSLDSLMPLPNMYIIDISSTMTVFTGYPLSLPTPTEKNRGQIIVFTNSTNTSVKIYGTEYNEDGIILHKLNIYYNSSVPIEYFPLTASPDVAIFQCVGTRGWVVIRYHSA